MFFFLKKHAIFKFSKCFIYYIHSADKCFGIKTFENQNANRIIKI